MYGTSMAKRNAGVSINSSSKLKSSLRMILVRVTMYFRSGFVEISEILYFRKAHDIRNVKINV